MARITKRKEVTSYEPTAGVWPGIERTKGEGRGLPVHRAIKAELEPKKVPVRRLNSAKFKAKAQLPPGLRFGTSTHERTSARRCPKQGND